MKLFEKRPAFHAAQCNNLNFIGEAQNFVDMAGYKAVSQDGDFYVQITIGKGIDAFVHVVNRSDWLLLDEAGAISVITDKQMRSRFEVAL